MLAFRSEPGLVLFFLFIPDVASRFLNVILHLRTPDACEELWVYQQREPQRLLGPGAEPALGALLSTRLNISANKALEPGPWSSGGSAGKGSKAGH